MSAFLATQRNLKGAISLVISTENRSLRGIGVVRADGADGAPILAVRLVDTRGRIGAAVFAVRVRNRIRIVGIGAEFAEILPGGGGVVASNWWRVRGAVAEEQCGRGAQIRGPRIDRIFVIMLRESSRIR